MAVGTFFYFPCLFKFKFTAPSKCCPKYPCCHFCVRLHTHFSGHFELTLKKCEDVAPLEGSPPWSSCRGPICKISVLFCSVLGCDGPVCQWRPRLAGLEVLLPSADCISAEGMQGDLSKPLNITVQLQYTFVLIRRLGSEEEAGMAMQGPPPTDRKRPFVPC